MTAETRCATMLSRDKLFSEFKNSFRLGMDYLKAATVSVVFYAVVFLIINLFGSYSQKKMSGFDLTVQQLDIITKTRLQEAMLSITGMLIGMAVIILAAYITATYLVYAIITKSRFSFKTALKFLPAFLIFILIFTIPFMFANKLMAEQSIYAKIISWALFLLVLLAYFHFTNLAYYFLASENRLWQSIKKAFAPGIRLRKFIAQYFFAAIVVGLIVLAGLLTRLLPESASTTISIIISALFINWLRFLVAKSVLSAKSH